MISFEVSILILLFMALSGIGIREVLWRLAFPEEYMSNEDLRNAIASPDRSCTKQLFVSELQRRADREANSEDGTPIV